MKLASAIFVACLLACSALAQPAPNSATVPVTLDHNRIIIDVSLPMPDGSTTRVRGWVDNGNPELFITERLAKKLGLALSGETQESMGFKWSMAQPPRQLLIGGMPIPLTDLKEARAMLERKSIGPGLSAEINLPGTVLRNYDVVVDYPNREFTIAAPGTIHFQGARAKAILNPQNALLQIPSSIAGKPYNLGLDVGATFSFISGELIAKLRQQHPRWPHMVGAVGAANLWGLDVEPGWELLRIAKIQYGPATLTQVGAVSYSKRFTDWYEKRVGVPTAGLIGANALLGYRVGLDYAHSAVFLHKTTKTSAPDLDVIGLVLRPEPDGRYTVLGVADFAGKPSVPEVKPGDVLVAIDKVPAAGATMGQIWSLLGGRPGDVRMLTFDRAGNQFTVKTTVRRFLSVNQGKIRNTSGLAKKNQR